MRSKSVDNAAITVLATVLLAGCSSTSQTRTTPRGPIVSVATTGQPAVTPAGATRPGAINAKWSDKWQFPYGTISAKEGKTWIEERPNGDKAFTFTLVRRTNRVTELFDKSRNFTLLIYVTGESEVSTGTDWSTWVTGRWIE